MFSEDVFLVIYFLYLNEWHTHLWKLEISESHHIQVTINFTLKIFLLFPFFIPTVNIINSDFDKLFLDVYVINSLTGWYSWSSVFPQTLLQFLMKTLFFQLLKSSYLINSEKAIKYKIFSLTYKPDNLAYQLSSICFPSFFPFLPNIAHLYPNLILLYYFKTCFF